MKDLNLEQLIRLENPEYKNLKFKIVRHKINRKGWESFDNLIRVKTFNSFKLLCKL